MQIVNRPVQLTFYPTALTATYTRSLKLQLALFRTSTDDKGKKSVKMDKTDPMKFTTPGEPITFTQALKLLTTIPYDSEGRKYHSKQVEFELAIDIDGTKSRMNKKINLKELVGNKKQSKFAMQSPQVVLHYKMELKIEGQKQSPEKPEMPKSPKRIKFEQDYASNANSGDHKENFKEQPFRRGGSRHKTTFNTLEGPPVEEIRFSQNDPIRKHRSHSRKTDKLMTVTEEVALRNSDRTLCIPNQQFDRSSRTKTRNQQLQSKYSQSLVNYRELEKKLNEKQSKIVQLSIKITELQGRLQLESKAQKSTKDLLKKEQTLRSNYQSQLASLRQEVKKYKSEVDRLTSATLNYQQSSNNIAASSENEIKALRDKVRHLERANQESVREGEYYQTNMKDKDTVINDLRGKIYSLDKENLQLQTKVKLLENKLERISSDYKAELQQLQQKVEEMKDQNKTLRISNSSPSSRGDLSEGNLTKKIEALEKQLERKEELLKRMTDLKKEADSQRNIENQNLKKELSQLKETIQKLESKQVEDASSTTSIEYRVQMQRMKKEMQAFKKSETKMLIEKTRLENLSNDLKDEVVKEKLKIANLLNIVQETGDQRLISEVYCALQ